MEDLKTRLSALLLEYQYTRSQRTLREIVNMIERMDIRKDAKAFVEVFSVSLT